MSDATTPDLHVLDYEVDGNEKRIVVQAFEDKVVVSTGKRKVKIPKQLVKHVAEALLESSDSH